MNSLRHSLWLSSAWSWFVEFFGRAAEPVLVATVLYASVKLLPVVHMPAGLDVVVFILQFVALDIGGIALGKLAKEAEQSGNQQGSVNARRMGTALVTIMIIGVSVAALEVLFPEIPEIIRTGIDTILLIARSVLAVLYSRVIHSLDTGNTPPPNQAVNIQTMQAMIDQLRTALETQIMGQQTAFQTAVGQLEERFMVQQNGTPSVPHETVVQASGTANGTVGRDSIHLVRKTTKAPVTGKVQDDTDKNKEAVYRLLDTNKDYSSRDLERLTGVPNTTAHRWKQAYQKERGLTDEMVTAVGQ